MLSNKHLNCDSEDATPKINTIYNDILEEIRSHIEIINSITNDYTKEIEKYEFKDSELKNYLVNCLILLFRKNTRLRNNIKTDKDIAIFCNIVLNLPACHCKQNKQVAGKRWKAKTQ